MIVEWDWLPEAVGPRHDTLRARARWPDGAAHSIGAKTLAPYPTIDDARAYILEALDEWYAHKRA